MSQVADKGKVRSVRWITPLTVAFVLQAEGDLQQQIRAAMQASVEQQKASVRRQAAPAQAGSAGSFFTISWPELPRPAVVGQEDCDPLPRSELDRLATEQAQAQGLEPRLVRAMIQRESAGKPCAVSVKGAQGLMQIMPATAKELGLLNPFDPVENVSAGARFLKQLFNRFGGNLPLILGAYNAGPARFEKEGGVPRIAETENYVAEIMSLLKTDPP